MPSISSLRAGLAVAVLGALIPVAASAQDDALPLSIVAAPNAPIAVTSCKVGRNIGQYGATLNAVVVNRTTHALLSVGIQIRYYDQDGTLVGQGLPTVNLQAPLASGDDANVGFNSGANLSEPREAIVRGTCRVQSATFTSQKHWTIGQVWREKLLPIRHDDMGVEQGGGGAASPQKSAAPRVQITVTNAWVDTVNGVTFVHDALAIIGGSADAQLRASDFSLAATLTNGARKTYLGLSQGAPTYAKLNPLGSQTTTAYEVAPDSDLGRLGIITIPAHGSVTTTVTFAISDAINTSDIRTVTVK